MEVSYQRVIHSSQWVNESVDISPETQSFFSKSIETIVWIIHGAILVFLHSHLVV